MADGAFVDCTARASKLRSSLLAAVLLAAAHANSAGSDPACQDAVNLCKLACPDQKTSARPWATLSKGVLSPCCPAGMDLVAPPVRSSAFTVTASESSYTPCKRLTVSIDVVEKGFKYLGLLLYAVDANENKVGSWAVRGEDADRFWTPPGCGGRAVMHANAGLKHLHHEFSFRAPHSGTGLINFRVLIKHGETNGGAFYWPGTEDLSLVEAAGQDTTFWTRTDAAGQTCTQACAAAQAGASCDATAMVAAMGRPDVKDTVGAEYVCRRPLLSENSAAASSVADCTASSGLTSNNDGFCWVRDDGKCKGTHITPANVCGLATPSVAAGANKPTSRFCACRRPAAAPLLTCERQQTPWPSDGSGMGMGPGAVFDTNTLVAKSGLVLASQVDVTLSINGDKAEATLVLEGPAVGWFAVAFGSLSMADEPYAIVSVPYTGSAGGLEASGVTERRLGNRKAGVVLSPPSPSLALVSIDQIGARRRIVLKRAMQGATPSHFSFATGVTSIDLLTASGNSADWAYHDTARSADTVAFVVHSTSPANGLGAATDENAAAGRTGSVPLLLLLGAASTWGLSGHRALPLVLLMVLTLTAKTCEAHNWINNPPSRTPGLSKQAPFPPRPTASSVSFVAVTGEPFPLEWATGHPNSHTYFTIVARADEAKLGRATEATLNKYLNAAAGSQVSTSAGGFASGPAFNKQHVRWVANGQRKGDKSGGPLPTPGSGVDGAMYTKKLTAADPHFIARPASWRCSRDKGFNTAAKCAAATAEIGQYEYIPAGTSTDVRAAYTSAAEPWILAVFKFKHVYKRPQDYDLARLIFPPTASPGEYVIQYQWRGYYDAFDVVLVAGSGGGSGGSSGGGGGTAPPPELVTETVWVKTDHAAFEKESNFVFKNNKKYKCFVVPANGDTVACVSDCESRSDCNAINIVPLNSPSTVRFAAGADVNIPWNKKKCKKDDIVAAAAGRTDALVCYGFAAPDAPDVGTAYTITDDTRDATFYSSILRKEQVTRVQGVTPAPTPPSPPVSPRWHFGDKCISCQEAADNAAQKGVGSLLAPTWIVVEECDLC